MPVTQHYIHIYLVPVASCVQGEMYLLTQPGGPRYAARRVNKLAFEALDALFPAGRWVRGVDGWLVASRQAWCFFSGVFSAVKLHCCVLDVAHRCAPSPACLSACFLTHAALSACILQTHASPYQFCLPLSPSTRVAVVLV